LSFQLAPATLPLSEAIDAYLLAMRHVYANGGIELSIFDLADSDAAFDVFAASDDLEKIDFPNQVPLLAGLAPALSPNFTRLTEPLEDALALMLIHGGASATTVYQDADELADAFCAALFAEASLSITHYVSHAPWSPYFYDVAWDYSYLSIDREKRRVYLLRATDTD
jgi:hypothetical protein